MIDKRATVFILVLASAAACGGWWLQQRLHSPTAAAPGVPAASIAAASSQPGKQPVDLALPDLDGKPQRLSQWRGQRVLVNFWATWCGPCRKEMPALSSAQKEHPQVRIVGVAMDQPQAVRDYLKRTPVDYPVLIGINASPDPSQALGNNVGGLPYSVLLGPDGRIIQTKLGPLDAEQLENWLDQ